MEMTDIMALSWAGKLAAAAFAALMLRLLLSWLDRRAGIDWREFASDMRADPRAAATYLGMRFLGAALLFGLVLAFG